MNCFLISIFLGISFCAGWNFESGHPNSYSTSHAPSGMTNEGECVLACITSFTSYLDNVVVTWYPPGSSCYCGQYAVTSITQNVDYMWMFLWRPPVNFNEDSVQIGSSYTAYVYVSEFIGGNDRFEIYVTKDLNSTNESGSIIIDSFADLQDSSQNQNGERNLERSEISKKPGVVVETFTDLTNYIVPHYTFTFMVTDTGVAHMEINWFISVFSNDKIVVIDLKSFKVSRPQKQCTAEVTTSSELFSEDEYRVMYHIKTAEGCVADVENVTINLISESMLEGEAVFNDSCINPTEYNNNGNNIFVKFSRLFIRSEICFMIKYKAVQELHGLGSKKLSIIGDLTYAEFSSDIPSIIKRNEMFSVVISKGVKGFFVRDVPNGYCISKSTTDDTLKATLQGCEFFKLGQHNLVSASGGCLSLDGTTPVIKECEKERIIKVKERDIEFLKEKQFLFENDDVVSLSSATGSYQRRYTGAFGLSSGRLHGNGDVVNSTGISIIVAGKDFVVCANPNKRNQRCASLNTETHKVTNLNHRMHTVIGYDSTTGLIYGESEKGNKLKIDKSHGVMFLSPNYWASILNNPNITLAKQFSQTDLLSADPNPEFVIDGTNYKATYYGIMDKSNEYIVIWTPEKDCHLRVGKSEAAALPTCMEIKRFCKTAQSGIFWIGGKDMSAKGQVYCDMEADGGGWVMIANYTVRNGDIRPIGGNLTSDIFEVAASNFERYLDNVGLTTLDTMTDFEEMRFYCYADKPGRTVHLASVKGTLSAQAKVFYISPSTPSQGTACMSYSVFKDDTSVLKDLCTEWGDQSGTPNKWGVQTIPSGNRIYDQSIGKPNYNVFDMGVANPATLTCDSFNEKPLKYGIWQVYVR